LEEIEASGLWKSIWRLEERVSKTETDIPLELGPRTFQINRKYVSVDVI
jgi:hypothetical protein